MLLPEKIDTVELRSTEESDKPFCFPAALWRFIELPDGVNEPREGILRFPAGHYRVAKLSVSSKSAEVWPEVIPEGPKGDLSCCPALRRERLNPEEVKQWKENKLAVFLGPKKVPKRTLGITELKKLFVGP